MNAELQNKLYEKYPKIFRQKDLSMQETCMCWGIETGDGWYNIIDDLCKKLQFICDMSNGFQLEATQVKEKFGTLRFYYNIVYKNDDEKNKVFIDIIDDLIYIAETRTKDTCEKCGKYGTLSDNGWIKCLCKDCKNK